MSTVVGNLGIFGGSQRRQRATQVPDCGSEADDEKDGAGSQPPQEPAVPLFCLLSASFCLANSLGDLRWGIRLGLRNLPTRRCLNKVTVAETISRPGLLLMTSRGAFRNLNLAHQPVSDRGHGFNETRLVDVVAQLAAQQPDATRKGTLRNGGIAPYGI